MKQLLIKFYYRFYAPFYYRYIRYLPALFFQRDRVAELRTLIKRLYPVVSKKELIRLGTSKSEGQDGDGGYLIPDDLDGIEACFSPGVGDITSFEEDCANRGIPCFLADASVNLTPKNDAHTFLKKHIGSVSEGEFITLDDWVVQSLPPPNPDYPPPPSDLLLQMDIEGGEYSVIPSVSEQLMKRFRIIVIELHRLQFLLDISDEKFKMVKNTFDKLLQTHVVTHIHPNNITSTNLNQHQLCFGRTIIPCIMEFTFVRKDRATTQYQKQFPHPLDCDNLANELPYDLPRCFIGK